MLNRILFYLTSEFMNFKIIDVVELLPNILVDSFLGFNMPATKILLGVRIQITAGFGFLVGQHCCMLIDDFKWVSLK